MTTDDTTILRCVCGDAMARLGPDGLLLFGRHHGERHTQTVSLDELKRKIDEAIQKHNERATMPVAERT